MAETLQSASSCKSKHECAELPALKRLNYFYGQMLSAKDFRLEQAYHRERAKLHNRCLHGTGVICGLDVELLPRERECRTEEERETDVIWERCQRYAEELEKYEKQLEVEKSERKRKELEQRIESLEAKKKACRERLTGGLDKWRGGKSEFYIECGLALDCHGNELMIRRKLPVNLRALLCDDDRKAFLASCRELKPRTLWVSICYHPHHGDPTPAVLPDECGGMRDCSYGTIMDCVKVEVAMKPPKKDTRCDPCCDPCCKGDHSCDDDPCKHACVTLARIDDYFPNRPLRPEQIDNGVRRHLGPSPVTTITGISWVHGATYGEEDAKAILGIGRKSEDRGGGFEIRFSRRIWTATVTGGPTAQPEGALDAPGGVIEVWQYVQRGESGYVEIHPLRGRVIAPYEDESAANPTVKEKTASIRYRITESIGDCNRGSKFLIIVRGSHILDECCRAVDGSHVGGDTPLLEGYERFKHDPAHAVKCLPTPDLQARATSAISSGGTFESWFYVDKNKRKGKRDGDAKL